MEEEIKWIVIWMQYGEWKMTQPFHSEKDAEAHADRYLRPQPPLPPPFTGREQDNSDKKYVTVRPITMPPRKD